MTGTVDLTLDSLAELPSAARSCVHWELDATAATRAAANGAGALEKEAWLSNTLLEWGTCGQAVYVDGKMAGFAMYAPPAYVPRAGSFPTSPVAPDSVILMALLVLPAHRGRGLGRVLVQGVARDLALRAATGCGSESARAIEAFGVSASRPPGHPVHDCPLPEGFLAATGFATVRSHRTYPRMRLDVRATTGWRADVGQAWNRLRSGITVPRAAAGLTNRTSQPAPRI
jgi:GNAT superfamily N-acetyltransferase